MKTNKKSNSFIILLLSALILTYSTILQFSIPSFVLCFGDDGHIAFEKTGDNFQCEKREDNRDHPIHKHKDLSHQEDDCQDIPLITVLSNLYLEKDGKIKPVKLALISEKLNTKNTGSVANFDINTDTTIINSSMKSLQTTILLI
jgi:hypothetical protein